MKNQNDWEKFMEIATIDLENKDAPFLFTQSLSETGFAVLKNHPVDLNMIAKAHKDWEDFFASEEKDAYLSNNERQDGYFRDEIANDKTVICQKEIFHVYPWGVYPKTMSGTTRDLYDQLFHLALILLQWIELHTPQSVGAKFSAPLIEMIKNSYRTLLRVIYYPPVQTVPVPASERADINLMTLIPASNALGLELKDSKGNWYHVSTIENVIIVNPGEMLELCSQGYYKSSTHRVNISDTRSFEKGKLVLPLFLYPRDEIFLSEMHTANSFRLERLSQK